MELARLGAEIGGQFAGQLGAVAAVIDSQAAMAALLLVITMGAVGLCIPGLLMPISFSAGLLMDGWMAVPVIAAGAVLGSHGLFLAARRGVGGVLGRSSGERSGEHLGGRLAGRLDRFAPHLERYGLAYVALLRVIGTPHVLVTLASAASPLRQGRFAVATLLGFLPSIMLSAGAGAAF